MFSSRPVLVRRSIKLETCDDQHDIRLTPVFVHRLPACCRVIRYRDGRRNTTRWIGLSANAKVGDKSLTAKEGGLTRTMKSSFSDLCIKYDDTRNVDRMAAVQVSQAKYPVLDCCPLGQADASRSSCRLRRRFRGADGPNEGLGDRDGLLLIDPHPRRSRLWVGGVRNEYGRFDRTPTIRLYHVPGCFPCSP